MNFDRQRISERGDIAIQKCVSDIEQDLAGFGTIKKNAAILSSAAPNSTLEKHAHLPWAIVSSIR